MRRRTLLMPRIYYALRLTTQGETATDITQSDCPGEQWRRVAFWRIVLPTNDTPVQGPAPNETPATRAQKMKRLPPHLPSPSHFPPMLLAIISNSPNGP